MKAFFLGLFYALITLLTCCWKELFIAFHGEITILWISFTTTFILFGYITLMNALSLKLTNAPKIPLIKNLFFIIYIPLTLIYFTTYWLGIIDFTLIDNFFWNSVSYLAKLIEMQIIFCVNGFTSFALMGCNTWTGQEFIYYFPDITCFENNFYNPSLNIEHPFLFNKPLETLTIKLNPDRTITTIYSQGHIFNTFIPKTQ